MLIPLVCNIENNTIVLKEGTRSIGDYAFGIEMGKKGNINTSKGYKNDLVSIVIPNSVIHIGNYAFAHCYNLKGINIPNSVTTISYGAFRGCPGLTSISIPNSVTTIGDEAFYECRGLISIYIGKSVTTIGSTAFNHCSNLSNVYSYASNPPTISNIGSGIFSTYTATLHVPAASLAAYFTANCWQNFENIIGDAISPTGISISNDSIDLQLEECLQLTATVTPDNASNKEITWISTDTTVATVNDGMVLAVGYGGCDIMASCFGMQAICHVSIIGDAISPTGISISNDSINLQPEECLQLTATVTPDNASNKEITWISTDTTVVTVNDGMVLAIGHGECDVIASCSGIQAICHVSVTNRIVLDQQEAMILPNHMLILTPTAPKVPQGYTVSSSDPTVAAARVLSSGKIQVVGIKEGTTIITVGSADGLAIPAICLVTVYTEPGDLNSDGFVNISDVTSLIDYLLEGDESSITTKNADVNGDGRINIADVTSVINSLLSESE